ncbi:MAG: YraN family protein [Spirochaetes bacterium]|nr:YraN family protein [Spirochaetota bacterium]
MKVPTRRERGIVGERRAGEFLREQGFEIIATNFRYGRIAEIDIIAKRGNLIVFAEVKSRVTAAFGGGLYSIRGKKIIALRRAAEHFLASMDAREDLLYRFDLIVLQDGSLQWIEDISRG